MKTPSIILLALVGLAGCGGGSSVGSLPTTHPATAAAVGSATVSVRVPTTTVTAAVQANARTTQSISPETAKFFVDLNGNASPAFNFTLAIGTSNCELDSTNSAFSLCTWQISEPVGNDTLSVAAASVNQGLYGAGPPRLLGYAKVHVTVKPGPLDANPPLTVVLDAIAGGGEDTSLLTLQYGFLGTQTVTEPTSADYPYIHVNLQDAAGPILFPLTQPWTTLLNPVSLTTNDTTGKIALGERIAPPAGSYQPDDLEPPLPTASLTNIQTLQGVDGIEIVDTLTNGQHAIFELSLVIPSVTVTDQEFPQIDTFPTAGGPQLTSWTGGGGGVGINLNCGPPTGTATSPCVQVNGP